MRLSLPRLIVAVLALASPAVAARLELPSQGLESRIEFWKKVYTQYGEDDIIVHDRIHVNLIYDVAARGEQASKISIVQQALDEIRTNLATPDERLDPAKATRAAAKLLHDNYNALGSWPLAITAYNHGRAGMMRAQSEVGSSDITKVIDEYRGPLFGYASMNFYSEFLAAVDVYNNYQQYFGELALDKPSMKQGVAPAPAQVASKTASKSKTQTAKASVSDKYKVRKGDTLTEIAQKFGLSVRELMDSNNLRNSVIHAGQILLVK